MAGQDRPQAAPFPSTDTLPAHTLPRKIAGAGGAQVRWPDIAGFDAVSAGTAGGRAPSAVVVLFVPGHSVTAPAHILLTRRSTRVRTHKGQIGLPGGRAESGDAGPLTTALRELEEELGLPPSAVEPVCLLRPLHGLDQSLIVPVVAVSQARVESLSPATAEVDAAFGVPWTCFTPGQLERFEFNIFGNIRTSQLFRADGHLVWGLTAAILESARLD